MRQLHPPLPCLVIAKTQTAGRGRAGKLWWSGSGALLMSLGFELTAETLLRSDLPELSLKTAEAVKTVLCRRITPECRVAVHPPNDVYADGKKICGILLESPSPKYGIIGIGLNVNNRLADIPPEFRKELMQRSITSLCGILGKADSIETLIDEIVAELNIRLFKEKVRADAAAEHRRTGVF